MRIFKWALEWKKCILKNIDKNKFKSTLFKIGGKILFQKENYDLYFDTKSKNVFWLWRRHYTKKKIRVRTYPNEKNKTLNLEKKLIALRVGLKYLKNKYWKIIKYLSKE